MSIFFLDDWLCIFWITLNSGSDEECENYTDNSKVPAGCHQGYKHKKYKKKSNSKKNRRGI